jgi:hypothetical protein
LRVIQNASHMASVAIEWLYMKLCVARVPKTPSSACSFGVEPLRTPGRICRPQEREDREARDTDVEELLPRAVALVVGRVVLHEVVAVPLAVLVDVLVVREPLEASSTAGPPRAGPADRAPPRRRACAFSIALLQKRVADPACASMPGGERSFSSSSPPRRKEEGARRRTAHQRSPA